MGLIPLRVAVNHEYPVGFVLREAERRKLPILKRLPDRSVITSHSL